MARHLKPGEFSKPDRFDRWKKLSEAERKTTKRARWQYRTEFRDYTGKEREVSGTGDTMGQAMRRLERNIEKTKASMSSEADLDSRTTIAELAKKWLNERRVRCDARPNTLSVYSSEIEISIVPAFGDIRLHEVTAAGLHRGLVKIEAMKSTKQTRTVLRQMLNYAMSLRAIESNPMVGMPSETPRDRKRPRALDVDEVSEVFAALHKAQVPNPKGGPRPDGRLIDIVTLLLCTGARIGEVLGLRWQDMHLDGDQPYVAFTGTIIEPRKGGAATLHRQPLTKGDRPNSQVLGHFIALPDACVEMLRVRYKRVLFRRLDDPVFANRTGGWLWPRNVHDDLRTAIIRHSTLTDIHPHLFRSTVATWVANSAGIALAQVLLGHSSPETTKSYWAEKQQVVDVRAILEQVWHPHVATDETG